MGASSNRLQSAIPFLDIRQGSQLDLIIRRFKQNRLAVFGLGLTIFYFAVSLVGPLFMPYDPHQVGVAGALEPPSTQHFFGTDQFGRDIFSRVLIGARVSLLVGAAVVAIATVGGVTLGLISGFIGGLVDGSIMRAVDVMFAFPNILLAIVIVAVLGAGLNRVILALGLAYIVYMTRVIRGSTVSEREQEYVLAAVSYGERSPFIMLREILPNILSTVLVQATLFWAFAILTEATLSYLGLSAQPPTVTWGIMVSSGQSVVARAPWTVIFPGMAIMVSVLSLTFLGVGLRDALDPHSDIESDSGGASV